jgi:hypothetical protein
MTEATEANLTEAVEAEASPNSYEGIRDASPVIPDRVRSTWQLADKQALRLREEYERIAGNEELNDEAKQQKAAAAYERNAQKIADIKQQARQALLREASLLERRAKPWPEKENKDISNDAERLSLAYSESERLVRLAEKKSKLKAGGSERPNPMFNVADFLRSKFAEGLHVGGVQGSALCHGALRAAEELGVDEHEVIDALRTDEQRVLLDNARRLEHFARLVDTSVPQIPRGLRGDNRRRSPVHGLAASASGQRTTKRKATWK